MIESLEKQDAIDAVVSDKNNRLHFRNMALPRQTQSVGGSGCKILKRIAFGEADQMRRSPPSREEFRPIGLNVVIGQPSPLAIIEIIQLFQRLAFGLTGLGDFLPRGPAATHRARIYFRDFPGFGDSRSDGSRLREAKFGQWQFSAAAEAFGVDSFYVAMSRENDFCHLCFYPGRVGVAALARLRFIRRQFAIHFLTNPCSWAAV